MKRHSTEYEADTDVRIGATLREFREMRGFKPDEAANEIGISRPHLANIEAGRRPMTRVLLPRFAKLYNVRQASIVPPGYFQDASTEGVPA
jgi:transcriptional regulator with XRE-family HTH domain